ncbi:ABC transporter permease [Ancylobacter lacus]|uniref:ABC transporter permease n=1 Tax=Ancylobacter lacus TaxID=2579970 RepID=UPI001BCCB140|nr:ABC transporter permease subunit [Ancylobacter lacus]MBS7538225.1 ABC transporter permease subunit [Ancylobacter lacus]
MLDSIVQYSPQLLQGLWVTLAVAAGSFACGLAMALFLAPVGHYGPPVLRRLVAGYVGLIRGLPELLIIFLVFYGGTVLLTRMRGAYFEVDALSAGIASLSVVSAAYCTEILRGALAGIARGQWEAAIALGLTHLSAFTKVISPQMVMRALPGLGNQWLVILKESALVSIVGLEELMRKSVVAAGATHQPLAFYLTAAVLYVLVTGISSLAINLISARLDPNSTR